VAQALRLGIGAKLLHLGTPLLAERRLPLHGSIKQMLLMLQHGLHTPHLVPVPDATLGSGIFRS
jgi:hypothetical protein